MGVVGEDREGAKAWTGHLQIELATDAQHRSNET
jgi:hypothetical protein